MTKISRPCHCPKSKRNFNGCHNFYNSSLARFDYRSSKPKPLDTRLNCQPKLTLYVVTCRILHVGGERDTIEVTRCAWAPKKKQRYYLICELDAGSPCTGAPAPHCLGYVYFFRFPLENPLFFTTFFCSSPNFATSP